MAITSTGKAFQRSAKAREAARQVAGKVAPVLSAYALEQILDAYEKALS